MAGIYIHIPFCRSRCTYCGFYTTTLGQKYADRYVASLCQEMEMRRNEAARLRYIGANGNTAAPSPTAWPFETLYLGGGTPSLLSPHHLDLIFQTVNRVFFEGKLKKQPATQTSPRDSIPEITLECNPDDVTDAFTEALQNTPVNRISIGAQTFDEQRLRFLRRRHTATQVDEAINRLRQAGINNISIDLMFGLPGETLNEWLADIKHAIALAPEHISAYSLTYEEGTVLYQDFINSKIKKLSEETERQMYDSLIDLLTAAGYEHYEISNFAKHTTPSGTLPVSHSPYRSRHNTSYWNLTPYIGLGAAAHSYDMATRSWNISDISQYMDSIAQGVRPYEYEVIGDQTRYNDLITTAMRTCEGVDLRWLSDKERQYLLNSAQGAIDRGLLSLSDRRERICLTRKGLFVSDNIMGDLMIV